MEKIILKQYEMPEKAMDLRIGWRATQMIGQDGFEGRESVT
jgi:hypothetical protein